MVKADDQRSATVELLARRTVRERGRRDAEQALFRAHACGPSRRTRDALVRRYLPMARRLTARYVSAPEQWDDLFQVACMALVHAIDRYDPDRRTSFSSFAYPTIQGELLHELRDRRFMVRPPRSMVELARRIERAEGSLAAETGRVPPTAEVARALDVDAAAVQQARQVRRMQVVESLSRPEDGDDVPPRSWEGVEDPGYERAEGRATLQPLLRVLSARDRRVLRLRFVEDRTQQEIADMIGISQMHVSRILRRAIDRMSTAALPEAA
jgi:RNA polymerase sigma-B factor